MRQVKVRVKDLYEAVGRMTGEGMGETSKVCRALLVVLANELRDEELIQLVKRYRIADSRYSKD